MKISQPFQRALAIAAVAAFYYFTPSLFPVDTTALRNWTLVAFFGGMIIINTIRGIKEMQSGTQQEN